MKKRPVIISRANPAEASKVIVQNIVIKPGRRKTQEVENWKNAITAFYSTINPNRTLFYDLLDDTMDDGHLSSVWNKRQVGARNKDLIFVRNGQEDEEINKILNCPDMRALRTHLIDAIGYGFTLLQINNIYFDEDEEVYKLDFDLIPRKHVHPERGYECISRHQETATRDYYYKELPLVRYMIWAGEPTDKGRLFKAALYVIFKRGDFGDWAQFAELFGMPFREARYDEYDEETRKQLEKAMEEYGAANYAILPKSAQFVLHDSSSGAGSNTVYKDFHEVCNAEISKTILGNTLTTEAGSKGARSLGEVHQDEENELKADDDKFILDILNSKFKAILKLFGYNVASGEIQYKVDRDADWHKKQAQWNVISGIRKETPVGDDYIYETFGIPKPDNYDELKAELNERNAVMPPVPFMQNRTQKKNIFDRLAGFFVQAPEK